MEAEELASWEAIYVRATSGVLFEVEDVDIKINTVKLNEEEAEAEGVPVRRGWYGQVAFKLPELNSSGHVSVTYEFPHFFSLDVFSALLDRAASGPPLTASFEPGMQGSMFTKLGDCVLRDFLYEVVDEIYGPWPDLAKEYEDVREDLHFHWY